MFRLEYVRFSLGLKLGQIIGEFKTDHLFPFSEVLDSFMLFKLLNIETVKTLIPRSLGMAFYPLVVLYHCNKEQGIACDIFFSASGTGSLTV